MISTSGIQLASGQLPALNEQPWLGYFTAFESKKYEFGMMSVGKIVLTPMGDKGNAVSHALAISIQIGNRYPARIARIEWRRPNQRSI